MKIRCPWCGVRPHEEFSYIGDATITRPPFGADGEDARIAMQEFVFIRDNPCGDHQELWYHSSGCRQFVRIQRNTMTHEIGEIDGIGEIGEIDGGEPHG